MENEVTKNTLLFAACKVEVGIEVASDYCKMLSNENSLPERIRLTYAGLVEVLEKVRELNIQACDKIEKSLTD